ncbi:MAG: hypothetical protein JO148_08340 [Acidimicrobiia bacterium]|nr:hypothetical protein [Acidimicrobiia bacterium]
MIRRAALAAALALALGACAAPRQTLGTRSSACFRSLPTAQAAVRHNGRLVGVRRIDRAAVLRAFPQAQLPQDRDFCLVAFSDDFRAETVDRPAGASTGRYAVVIVNMRGTTTFQTFLADHLPLRVRHR